MSTTTQTQTDLPAGTFAGGHRPLQRRVRGSLRGRDVPRRGARLRRHARRRQARRLGPDREHHGQGGEPPGAPALPRVLRRRASPRRLVRRRPRAPDGDAVEATARSRSRASPSPAALKGTIIGPAVDHFGATRVGLKLETTVDRTDVRHELEHAAPERRAGARQRGHAQGRADPRRPGGVEPMRVLAISGSLATLRTTRPSSALSRRRRRRASRSSCGTG